MDHLWGILSKNTEEGGGLDLLGKEHQNKAMKGVNSNTNGIGEVIVLRIAVFFYYLR